MTTYDRLGGLDASFLALERLETPMHVGSLAVFEAAPFLDENGRFRLAEVRDLVASRLHLIPRFRKKIMQVPLDAGLPIWVDDDRFDIGYHVRLTALPAPGTRTQLLNLFERVQSQVLDRTRPLWELWFVEGIEGGHIGLFQKTHHSLVDGVSGVDVATVLLDFEPSPTPVETPEWRAQPAPPPARLLVDTLKSQLETPRAIAEALRGAAEFPRRAADAIGRIARSFATFGEGSLVASHTSLNDTVVGRNRRFGLVQCSLDDVRTVRNAFGGTVNDVVLAGVTGGVARILETRGELHADLHLKVFVPVSVRGDDEHMALGNRVSGLFVPIPIGEPDPVERLRAIHATTEGLKEREQAVAASTLTTLANFGAPTLLSLAARLGAHQPFFNLICTNVPGPQVPLYCMGARMLEAYPMVPLWKNLNVGIAILSYCGTLHIGILADRDRWPDLDVLEAGIHDAFAELVKLAEGEAAPDDGDDGDDGA